MQNSRSLRGQCDSNLKEKKGIVKGGWGWIVYTQPGGEYRKKKRHTLSWWVRSCDTVQQKHDQVSTRCVCTRMLVSQFIALFRLVHVIIRIIWVAWNWYGELEECVRSGHEFISTCLIIFSSYRYRAGLLRDQKGGGQHFRLLNLILVRKKGLMGRYAGLKWFCTLMCYHNQEFSTPDAYRSRAVAMVDTHCGVGVHFSHMDVWKTTYVDICTCKIHVTLQIVFFCSLFGQFVSHQSVSIDHLRVENELSFRAQDIKSSVSYFVLVITVFS